MKCCDTVCSQVRLRDPLWVHASILNAACSIRYFRNSRLRSYMSPSPCQNRLFESHLAPSTSSSPDPTTSYPSVRICSARICNSRIQITTIGTVRTVWTIVSRTISSEQHAEQLERSAWRHGRVRHAHDKSAFNTETQSCCGLNVKLAAKQVFWRLSGPAATRSAGIRSARL